MATIGSTSVSTPASTISPIKNPVIYNITTSPTPNTETSFVLGPIKEFIIANQGSVNLKVAYVSAGPYLTVIPGCSYDESGIADQTITFYIQAAAASQRVEVVSWD